jgi:thiol-disulfide isomerase/thioredoxin
MKKTIILAITLVLLLSLCVQASNITILFFYGDGCPHCTQEKPFLENLQQDNAGLKLESFEVWYHPENAKKLDETIQKYNISIKAVPTTIINDKVWVGFSDTVQDEITQYVTYGYLGSSGNNIVNIPVLGSVDVSKSGLFAFTLIMGTLDGFNACAMWVLCFLLSLLIYSQSRRHVFIVGGTFIFISGLVYFLFMAAWMNAFIIAGHLRFIQIAISLLAIVFGLINIKDYFYFGKGISLIIPEDKKPKIMESMKSLMNPKTGLVMTLIGVSSLAFMVNLVELLCTAGFPAVYTKILAGYKLPWFGYYFYLLIYIIMYMIDDIMIFTVVVLTMTSKRFTEKYGKLSKLISGIIILILGLIMFFNPGLLMLGG